MIFITMINMETYVIEPNVLLACNQIINVTKSVITWNVITIMVNVIKKMLKTKIL
jgi:hypothetical protein